MWPINSQLLMSADTECLFEVTIGWANRSTNFCWVVNDVKKMLHCRLEDDVWSGLDRVSDWTGQSAQDLTRLALREYLRDWIDLTTGLNVLGEDSEIPGLRKVASGS